MTTITHQHPTTVDQVLFPDGDTALVTAGAASLAVAAAVGWANLTPATQGAVLRDLLRAVHAILDVNLGDLLIDGWRTHAALTEAAARTLKTGVPETVDLATHRIEHQTTPRVDLLRDGAEIGCVRCTIAATADVVAVCARVDAGRLVSLHSGDATLVVSLRLEDREVASSRLQVHVPVDVRLGDGVWLVEDRVSEVVFVPSQGGWARTSSADT